MDIKKITGQRINTELARNNLKQKDLAAFLGVTSNTVSYFCSGKRTPNTAQLVDIARFFDVTTDYLLGLSPSRQRYGFLTAACQYTGISAEAAENLADMSFQQKLIASSILESSEFRRIIDIFISAQLHKDFLSPSCKAATVALNTGSMLIRDESLSETIPPVFVDALTVLAASGLEPMYKQQLSDEMNVLFERMIDME